MSLILDALNRSQQEPRERDGIPGLASIHGPAPAPAAGPARALPWAAMALALVAVAWLLWERQMQSVGGADARPITTESPGASAGGGRSAADSAPVASPVGARRSPGAVPAAARDDSGSVSTTAAPAVNRRVGAPALAPGAPDPAVTALYSSAPAPASAGESRGADAEVEGRGPATSGVPAAGPAVPADGSAAPDRSGAPAGGAATAVAAAAPGQESPAKETSGYDVDALVSQAEATMAQRGLTEHSAPFVSELSQIDKDAIPTIFYSKHDFAEAGGASVILNGKSLGAGDAVGGGVRLEEILPDSVVLSHHGVEFRLKALNSWVNL